MDDLLLLSGNDIPFVQAQISIHQPTIKEIAYIGEESFFIGCELLKFSKDSLRDEDKTVLSNQSEFDIFMSIMKDKKNNDLRQNRISALLVLDLMFPSYRIIINSDTIELAKDDEESHFINKDNYDLFKDILIKMFCLNKKSRNEPDYNPGNDRAREIAEKLKKGRQQVAAANKNQKFALFSRYTSILSIALNMDLNILMNYTVYQLFDVFERYEMKYIWDMNMKQRMFGAKDVEDVDNWMDDIHK